MCRKPPTAFEWAHFFVTFLLRNKKVKKKEVLKKLVSLVQYQSRDKKRINSVIDELNKKMI